MVLFFLVSMKKNLHTPEEGEYSEEGKKLNQQQNAETALTLLGVSKFQMETIKKFW